MIGVIGHQEGRGDDMGISGKVVSPALAFLKEMGITVERQVKNCWCLPGARQWEPTMMTMAMGRECRVKGEKNESEL